MDAERRQPPAAQRQALARTQSCLPLAPDILASRTVTPDSCCLQATSYVILREQQKQNKTSLQRELGEDRQSHPSLVLGAQAESQKPEKCSLHPLL